MSDDARELLTKIAHETSLRYAIQVRSCNGVWQAVGSGWRQPRVARGAGF